MFPKWRVMRTLSALLSPHSGWLNSYFQSFELNFEKASNVRNLEAICTHWKEYNKSCVSRCHDSCFLELNRTNKPAFTPQTGTTHSIFIMSSFSSLVFSSLHCNGIRMVRVVRGKSRTKEDVVRQDGWWTRKKPQEEIGKWASSSISEGRTRLVKQTVGGEINTELSVDWGSRTHREGEIASRPPSSFTTSWLFDVALGGDTGLFVCQ